MTELLYTYHSSSGEDEIRVHGWLPDEMNGIIQYHHGVTSHIDLSSELALWFVKRGYGFIGNDCLGHGIMAYRAGKLGWFARENGWDHVVNDFRALYDQIEERFPAVAHFVYGNSMGSFVVRSLMIRFPELKPEGVILTAGSMNGNETLDASLKLVEDLIASGKDPYKGTGKIQHFAFGNYCERLKNPKTPFDWICRSNPRRKEQPNDGYSGFLLSPSLFRDMTVGQIFNSDPNNIAKMNKQIPYYLASGQEDPAGNYGEGPMKLKSEFEKAGIADVELHLWPGARHELFADIDGERIMEDILRWLNEKT